MLSDLERKQNALLALAENFGKAFSEELLTMWLKLLAHHDAQTVEQAIMLVICEYEYKTLPPFAVLKKALDRTRGKREVSPEALALAEWGKVLDDIAKLGAYAGPPPDMHPVTAYALRCMGGWGAACQWETDTLGWKEKDFCAAWKLAYGREEIMALGATALAANSQGLESTNEILGRMVARAGLEA